MDYQIYIVAKRLIDSSLVWDVCFNGMTIPAATDNDAYALADKLAAAINEHSLDTADVAIEWNERAA